MLRVHKFKFDQRLNELSTILSQFSELKTFRQMTPSIPSEIPDPNTQINLIFQRIQKISDLRKIQLRFEIDTYTKHTNAIISSDTSKKYFKEIIKAFENEFITLGWLNSQRRIAEIFKLENVLDNFQNRLLQIIKDKAMHFKELYMSKNSQELINQLLKILGLITAVAAIISFLGKSIRSNTIMSRSIP